ncbi:MAG: hypothetical protein OXH76_20410 [Boseongicola sp.]|nr:hypothetical protein [Boseongicola sp.]
MLRLPARSLSAGRVGHRLSLVRHPQVKARDLLPGNPVTVAALLLAPQVALKALRPPERRLQLPVRGEAQALAGLRQDGEVLRPEGHADDAWLSRMRGSPA